MADRDYKITYFDPQLVGKKIIKTVKEELLSEGEKDFLLHEINNHFNHLPEELQERFMIANIMSNKFIKVNSNGKG
jgi:hypothetical protein